MSSDQEQLLPPNEPTTFESLCLDLWREIWGDPGAQKNGRSGQPQAGVDIFGRAAEGWVGVQCKQKDGLLRTSVTAAELAAEVTAARSFTPRLRRFLLATSGPRDARLQERARELTETGLFDVEIWSWQDIWHEIHGRRALFERLFPIYWPLQAGATFLATVANAAQRQPGQDVERFEPRPNSVSPGRSYEVRFFLTCAVLVITYAGVADLVRRDPDNLNATVTLWTLGTLAVLVFAVELVVHAYRTKVVHQVVTRPMTTQEARSYSTYESTYRLYIDLSLYATCLLAYFAAITLAVLRGEPNFLVATRDLTKAQAVTASVYGISIFYVGSRIAYLLDMVLVPRPWPECKNCGLPLRHRSLRTAIKSGCCDGCEKSALL